MRFEVFTEMKTCVFVLWCVVCIPVSDYLISERPCSVRLQSRYKIKFRPEDGAK